MKKRFYITLVFFIVGIVAAAMVFALYPREPYYEGKPLSYWIWTMNAQREGPAGQKPRVVVRQLATNSIPLLLRWLQQEDRPSLTYRYDQIRQTVLFWLMRHKIIENRPIASLRDFNPSHYAMAMWALPELDSAGRKSAIPTLIRLLGVKSHEPDDISHSAGVACLTLSKLAPESIPPLINALTNQEFFVRVLASGALSEIGTNAKAAIPVLRKMLKDSDLKIRMSAARTMGKVGGDPQEFIPVVIQDLQEKKFEGLDYDLEILSDQKEHAKAAIPVLLGILTQTAGSNNPTNAMFNQMVLEALQKIEPDVAAKTKTLSHP